MPSRRWEDNYKMDLKGIVVNMKSLAASVQDRDN